ncbi:MAG: hypothetical protein KJO35_09305 [Gammaproteobacteria bacterium]|nr:hypothetical protein [Gammaproteobacteria bacterium]
MTSARLGLGAVATLLLLVGGCPLNETPDSPSAETRMPVNKRPGNPGTAAAKTDEAPPELLDKIRTDLAGRSNVPADQFTVVRAERVTFRNGALGCPEPGRMYTQALIDGYWIVLEKDGKQFDYRATGRGAFRLCEKGQPPLRRESEM